MQSPYIYIYIRGEKGAIEDVIGSFATLCVSGSSEQEVVTSRFSFLAIISLPSVVRRLADRCTCELLVGELRICLCLISIILTDVEILPSKVFAVFHESLKFRRS